MIRSSGISFSGSSLKLMAVGFMLMDHFAAYFLAPSDPLYGILRQIGRLSFPLYVFLLVEGFVHTRSRKKYALNLLSFAIISEIPWNLAHGGTLLYPSQNVMWTLLLGFLAMWVIEDFNYDQSMKTCLVLIFMFISAYLGADYGFFGFGLILLMYALREQPLLRAVIGACWLLSRGIGGLAFLPISLYNGQRGFIHSPVWKYLMYAIYPGHLLLIWILKSFVL